MRNWRLCVVPGFLALIGACVNRPSTDLEQDRVEAAKRHRETLTSYTQMSVPELFDIGEQNWSRSLLSDSPPSTIEELSRRPKQTVIAEAEKPAKKEPEGPTEADRKKAEETAPALRKRIVEAVGEGRTATAYVNALGTRVRGRVTGADEEGVTVDAAGVTVRLEWEKMSPKEFYSVARKFVDDHEALYLYCYGMGLKEEAEAERRGE